GEVVIGIMRRLYSDGAVKNGRRPLIGLPADKTVELVKTGVRGPTVIRSGNRDLPGGRFVVLAEGSSTIAIESQHFRYRCDTLRADAGIAGECRRKFHN